VRWYVYNRQATNTDVFLEPYWERQNEYDNKLVYTLSVGSEEIAAPYVRVRAVVIQTSEETDTPTYIKSNILTI
jgi:hypothetical protein